MPTLTPQQAAALSAAGGSPRVWFGPEAEAFHAEMARLGFHRYINGRRECVRTYRYTLIDRGQARRMCWQNGQVVPIELA